MYFGDALRHALPDIMEVRWDKQMAPFSIWARMSSNSCAWPASRNANA
jgi:hypothetical protein